MLAKNIMTQNPTVVHPETRLVDAARMMFDKNYNGLPVTDPANKLVGLVTQQDLILHTNSVHLPTLINILSQIKVYKKDSSLVKGDLQKLLDLNVSGVMNHEPLTIDEDMPVEKVAEVFAGHHAINPIPVITRDGQLSGIISRYDILKFLVGPSWQQATSEQATHEKVDVEIGSFINDFESRFLLVSKSRTKLWIWLAAGFAIVGFAIAWFLILRVNNQSF